MFLPHTNTSFLSFLVQSSNIEFDTRGEILSSYIWTWRPTFWPLSHTCIHKFCVSQERTLDIVLLAFHRGWCLSKYFTSLLFQENILVWESSCCLLVNSHSSWSQSMFHVLWQSPYHGCHSGWITKRYAQVMTIKNLITHNLLIQTNFPQM